MDKKMKMVERGMEDRISHLPRHLIECILDRMPLRDVVRMSILSRAWRNMWATFPKLELNRQFYEDNIQNKHPFPLIVSRILSLHFGPILKFHLHVPKFINFYINPDLDRWMYELSKKALKDLILDYPYNGQPYKLPIFIFDCPHLKFLKLINCVLEPPHGFGGFCNLTRLSLLKVSFSSAQTFENLLPSAPRLRRLTLINCIGTVNLRVHAPHLRILSVHFNNKFYFELCGSYPNLRGVWVHTDCKTFDKPEGWNTVSNLNKLLYNIPRVERLLVSGSSLKFLALGVFSLFLKTFPRRLINLDLWDVQFKDLSQIRAALCIIRSSPNLRNLKIQSSKQDAVGEEEVIKYLEKEEKQDVRLRRLRQLQTVRLSIAKVSGVEVLLAKLLLAKVSALETMTIGLSEGIDAVEGSRILTEIMGFPRASVKTRIICLQPESS